MVNLNDTAGSVAGTPVTSLHLLLPDGSCIPSTPERCRIAMKQVRSAALRQARAWRRDKAAALLLTIGDHVATRALKREHAEFHRRAVRWAACFKGPIEVASLAIRPSMVNAGLTQVAPGARDGIDAVTRPRSSWVIDASGYRGVLWQQSYLGRRSAGFKPGAARANWEYIVRADAVLVDEAGEPVIVTNMGDDRDEIGVAWQAMTEASTRANAKIQLLAIAPMDSDMAKTEMGAALTHFCETVLAPLDLPYSAAIHTPPADGDPRNFHAHIAFSLRPMRRFGAYCWQVADDVCGELDGPDGVRLLRHLWAHSMTEAAAGAGSDRRYTGLDYRARGLDLEPGEHLGEGRAAIVKRGGLVQAHELNTIKAARNTTRRTIRDAESRIAALVTLRANTLERMARGDPVTRPATVIPRKPRARVKTVLSHTCSTEMAKLLSSAVRSAVGGALTATPKRSAAVAISTEPASKPPSRAVGSATGHVVPIPPARPAVRLMPSAPTPPARHIVTPNKVADASVWVVSPPPRRPVPRLVPVDSAIVGPMFFNSPKRRASVLLPISKPKNEDRNDVAIQCWEALTLARSERFRKRRKRAGADDCRLETLPALGSLLALDGLPSLDALVIERQGGAATAADPLDDIDRERIARLATIDPYVTNYGGDDGTPIETDHAALKAIGVDWDWLRRPGVQRALHHMRDDQRLVLATLTREAAERPLAFAATGARFWPRDLPADHVRRLDRWAIDDGFQSDVFATRLAIERAHDERAERQRSTAALGKAMDRGSATPIADGFGGWREGSPPMFEDDAIRVHAQPAAFAPSSGRPSDQLLQLLILAGRHPRRIAFADDGRLMALPGAPMALATLLHPWRRDDRVVSLVIETVRASREQGRAVWPETIAAAVHAYAARSVDRRGSTTDRSPPDRGLGPSR